MLVNISQLEILYIDDCLSATLRDGRVAYSSIFSDLDEEFIIYLGRNIILTEELNQKEVTLDLTKSQLLALREIAKSTVVVGSEKVGMSLKIKIYKALVSIDAEDITREFEVIENPNTLNKKEAKEAYNKFLKQEEEPITKEDS